MPRRILFEERFILAEERDEILAVVRCRIGRKRLLLGPLAVDPWVGEYRFAAAMYSGAKDLAQAMGLREVWGD